MKFLADAGVSPRTVSALKAAGHDTIHIRELGMDRAADSDILALARSQSRIVLTFDLDFGDLMALGVHLDPSVIIFRLLDETPQSVNEKLLPILESQNDSLTH